jgi:hypothetical protein
MPGALWTLAGWLGVLETTDAAAQLPIFRVALAVSMLVEAGKLGMRMT